MGYTHYWQLKKTIPEEQWALICADSLKLIEAFCDVQNVKVNGTDIVFDGEGCERFRLSRYPNRSHGYCKTRHEPCDKLICAVLMIAEQHSPEMISVSSDACMGSQPDGWPAAARWASKVLGYKVKTPWKYSLGARMHVEWHYALGKLRKREFAQKIWLRFLGEWIAIKVHFGYWCEVRPFVRCPICHYGWLDQAVVRAFKQNPRFGVACCDECCAARGIEIITE
jgi:hypothetical protein